MQVFANYPERLIFFCAILAVLGISLFIKHEHFKSLKSQNVYFTQAFVQKQYKKHKNNRSYWVLKLKTANGLTLYTTTQEDIKNLKNRHIKIGFLTSHIRFLDTLKSFYARSVYISVVHDFFNPKESITNYFLSQHESLISKEFFAAIFFGQGVCLDLRKSVTNLGIAHIIALSGFHLGIILGVIGFIFILPYRYFQKRYFPYRNALRDLFIVSTIAISFYMYLVGFIPSFVRAFFMSIFAYFLASNNLKLRSFENLLWVGLILLAIFPSLAFSIGFFLSMSGVFYIFLLLEIFKFRSKLAITISLSVFLFFAINPLAMYFFPYQSHYQFFSPLLTILAPPFFIIEIIAHIINFGWIFDWLLEWLFSLDMPSYERHIPTWLFWIYIVSSLFAIKNKQIFIAFCTLSLLVNLYLYY